jgi:hypothetical protein
VVGPAGTKRDDVVNMKAWTRPVALKGRRTDVLGAKGADDGAVALGGEAGDGDKRGEKSGYELQSIGPLRRSVS